MEKDLETVCSEGIARLDELRISILRRMADALRVDEEELTEEDNETLNSGKCPKCGSEHFVEGPSGGYAVNIACENGHRFWFAPPFTAKYQGIIRVERKGDTLEAYF